jgi:hypothetical protein
MFIIWENYTLGINVMEVKAAKVKLERSKIILGVGKMQCKNWSTPLSVL